MTTASRFDPKILTVVISTVFLDLIGFGILIPIQPFLALSYGASPSTVTLLSASFSLMQFLFMPFWGRLSDKIGRRPIMLISIATSVIGFSLFAFSSQLWMLFLARSIAGAGSANVGIAQAIIADSTSTHNRAKGMGLIGVAFGAGYIIGPAIGGFFGQISLSAPAVVAALLAILNLVLAYFLLPETSKLRASAKVPKKPIWSLAGATRVDITRNIPQLLLLSFMFTCSFSLLEQSVALIIDAVWSKDPGYRMIQSVQLTSYFLMCVGLTAIFIQGILLGRLVKRLGEKALLLIGTTLLTVGMVTFPLVVNLKSTPPLLFLAFVLAFGTGLIMPSTASLLSRHAGDDEQGTILGYGQSLSALGRVIGPALSGFLFQLKSTAPFHSAATIMSLAFGITLLLRPTQVLPRAATRDSDLTKAL